MARVSNGIVVSEICINAHKGGKILIDTSKVTLSKSLIPSPRSSGDFAFNFGLQLLGGFVMNCHVQVEGRSSKPTVQLALRHITCVEDVAVFMALTTAVDLSIGACKPFSRKLKRVSEIETRMTSQLSFTIPSIFMSFRYHVFASNRTPSNGDPRSHI